MSSSRCPMAATLYKDHGDTAKARFDASILHGQTHDLADKKRNEIFFAVIFCPGK